MFRTLSFPGMLAVFFAFSAISSCGGGGGGASFIPYVGPATPALVTEANVQELALGSYTGWDTLETGVGASPLSDTSEAASGSPSERISIKFSNLDRVVGKIILSESGQFGTLSLDSVPIDDEVQGYCAGTYSMTGSVNDLSGRFNLTMTFDNFSDDCEVSIDGTIRATGVIDLYTLGILSMNMSFPNLTMAYGGQSLTFSGTWSIDNRTYPYTELLDVVIHDDLTDRTYWMDNYRFTITIESNGTASFEKNVVTGRYFDPDHGYVDVASELPLAKYYDDLYHFEGILVLAGENDTGAKFEIMSTAAYRVTCDADGDGDYDDLDTGIRHWPGANNPPVANAGSVAFPGLHCTITLDGSGSHDIDGDDIASYLWTLIAVPEGSRTALSNPSSVNPSFTPDVSGRYEAVLIVNDGIEDSVPDPGSSCSVGNDDRVCADVPESFGCPYAGMTIIGVGSNPEAVAVGDVNGDGRKEAVLATSRAVPDPENDYRIHVFLQGEDGTLQPAVKYPAGNGKSVDIGDLNGDGLEDVAVTVENGVGILYQGQAGHLAPIVTYPSNHSSSTNAWKLRVGDLNNDGRNDIAAIDWGTQSADVDIFHQNPDGTMEAPVSYSVLHGGYDDMEVGDINGDGLTDVVVMSGQGDAYDNIGVLYQNESGTFDSAVYYDLGGEEVTSGLALGDVNGDGRDDVVLTVADGPTVVVFYQNDSGTLNSAVSLTSYGHGGRVEVSDIDGDGREDIVDVQEGWERLEVIRQNADGTLAPYALFLYPYSGGADPHGLVSGDIDNNGIKDIVAAESSHGLVVIYDSVFQ
ncbi:MAG: VCBS repeat-containing protein [bacterium]|nr:MAG: VCBS repeat-containing protein [bacterium]